MAYKTLDKGPFFLLKPLKFLWGLPKWKFYATEGPPPQTADRALFLKSATDISLVWPAVVLIRPLRPASQNRLDTDPRYRHTYTEIAMYYDWLCLTGPSITSRTVHKHLGGGGVGCKMKFSSRIFQGPSLNLKNSWGSNLLADENKGKPHALGFNSTSWMSIEKLQCEKVLPPPPQIECTNLPNPRTFADAGRIGLTSGSVSLPIASSCPSGPMNLLVTAGVLKKMCKWEFY